MNAKLHSLCLALASFAIIQQAVAQGTAFTYQGQLQNNGSPANGNYDLTFTLYATNVTGSVIAGPVTNSAIGVTNGVFTTMLDFGPGVLTGGSNWLELGVQTNGGSNFISLSPRQQLTPVAYAIYAEGAGSFSGTLSSSQLTSVGNTNGGGGNFFVGPAGNFTTSGSDNTATGVGTFVNNISGSYNSADGELALYFNTSGSNNTANGFEALFFNTNGGDNTASGSAALKSNTSGNYNTAVGSGALVFNTIGAKNTALGFEALFDNVNASENTAVGFEALRRR